MKTKKCSILLLAFCLFAMSCDKESDSDFTYQQSLESQANLKALPYLKLSGEEYLLDLSMSEAFDIGISGDQYTRILNEIQTVNNRIQELRSQNVNVNLVNPEQELEMCPPMLSTRSEIGGDPVTNITNIETTGQEKGTKNAFIPQAAHCIKVSFFCGGLIDLAEYEVTVNGRTSYGNGTAVMGYIVKADDLTPAATNVTGTFGFRTACSNGGRCSFYF